MNRITSIDRMRGLVMIIMALDHTRDLIHVDSIAHSPTDLTTTTPAIFFTRWITHLCAPVFVFLSGTSAYLSYNRDKNSNSARNFLLKRGIWLILLEFTLVNFGVWFDIHFNVLLFDVIATIGCGFIMLGLLIKLPAKTICIIGLSIISLHGIAPLVPLPENSIIKTILMPLFAPGAFPIFGTRTFVMGYPPIPWLGIILTGFGAGSLFLRPVAERRRIFRSIALGSLAVFILLRLLNIYGDPVPWVAQKNTLFSVMSFLNVTKYPPSLEFCALMLGLMFLLLSIIDKPDDRFAKITSVYGQVPLFYFLIHWYIIHPLMFLIIFLQGYGFKDLSFGFNFGRPKSGGGLTLLGVYLVWIAVVIVLYPICKWYGKYKLEHKEKKWLRYL